MNLTKYKGLWLKTSNLMDDYAYQLFLNEHMTSDSMTQGAFVDYSKQKINITINGKPLKDYYRLAEMQIRKDKLLKLK